MSIDQVGRDAAQELRDRTAARTDLLARRAALGRSDRNRRRLRVVTAVVAVLVVAAAAVWVRALVRLDEPAPTHRPHVQRLTGNGVILVETPGGHTLVDPSTGQRTPLTQPFGLVLGWSPDGQRLAYETGAGLYVHSVSGGEDRLVGQSPLQTAGLRDGPLRIVWSDDGTTFAVRTSDALRQLPASIWAATAVSPSPDFSQVAFVGWPHGGHPELYVINADGTGLHRLPARAPSDYGPILVAWSPDGSTIAYQEFGQQRAQHMDTSLMTIRPDGTNRTRVGAAGWAADDKNGPGPCLIWSPDSHSLAFLGKGVGSQRDWGLYVMALDGHTQRLMGNVVRGDQLFWQPR